MTTRWVATALGGPEVLRLQTVELGPPGPGEVTVEVRAAGMNPVDYKHFEPGQGPSVLPLPVGEEVAGVLTAIGPATQGLLEVPVGATYPLQEAPKAVAALMGHHPYGKLALVA